MNIHLIVLPILFATSVHAQQASHDASALAGLAMPPNASSQNLSSHVLGLPVDPNVPIPLLACATPLPADTGKKVQSLDTVLFDMYGNLRVDDPLYNKKAPWYVPALNIVGQEILLNLADHYLLNFDWARVGFRSWGQNLRAGAPWGNGWIWD
ncbi:MAG TPA: hypothetical protein VFD13_00745, partial [Candidatus Kapabacteria bacterium]|nr:hypothetical protein [Candidatus Kapabacteria bacterium]